MISSIPPRSVSAASEYRFSFLAAGPLRYGIHAALPGYTLTPAQTLTELSQKSPFNA